MNNELRQRVLEEAEYIINKNSTVRCTAKQMGISKSTVHKDITSRLTTINKELYDKVRCILETNKRERHIRGGIATREKYLKLRREKFENTLS